MKRKTIYVCVAFLTFLTGVIFASFWLSGSKPAAPLNPDVVGTETFLDAEAKAADSLLRNGLAFKVSSVACGFDSYSQDYETSDGKRVNERNTNYHSEIKAREAFKKEIANIKPIHPIGISDKSLDNSAKLVGIGEYNASGKEFALIAYLRGTSIYVIKASSIRYAVAFEKSR
jgi:hypothetical protein